MPPACTPTTPQSADRPHPLASAGSGRASAPPTCVPNASTHLGCHWDEGSAVIFVRVVRPNPPPSFDFAAQEGGPVNVSVSPSGAGVVYMPQGGGTQVLSLATGITRGNGTSDWDEDISMEISFTSGRADVLAAPPVINASGHVTLVPGNYGSANYTVAVVDGGGTLCGGVERHSRTLTVVVVNYNDPPTFSLRGVDEVLLYVQDECRLSCTVPGFAVNMSVGAGEDDQTFAFSVRVVSEKASPEGAPMGSMFVEIPSIDAGGTLRVIPKEGYSGYAILAVAMVDSGGTSPGVDTSIEQRFAVNVSSRDEPPSISFVGGPAVYVADDSLTKQTVRSFVSILPGMTPRPFPLPQDCLSLTRPPSSAGVACAGLDYGQAVSFTVNTTSGDRIFSQLPALVNGSATCNGPGSLLWDLTFSIAPGSSGFASVEIVARDSQNKTSRASFTVFIVSRNNAPTMQPIRTPYNITAVEGDSGFAGPKSIPFAVGVSPGGSGEEVGQLLTFIVDAVSNTTGDMFVRPPRVDCRPSQANCIAADLVFELVPGAFGEAEFVVRVADDGGTDCSDQVCGDNVSLSVPLLFRIREANVAPSFALRYAKLDVTENSACWQESFPAPCYAPPGGLGHAAFAHRRFAFAQNIRVGDALEVSALSECSPGRPCRLQTATFSVEPVASSTLFSVPPQIDFDGGVLTFTLAPYAFGVQSFTVTLTDSGGAESMALTLSFEVHRRNFPPTISLTNASIWVPPFLSTSYEAASLFTAASVGPPASAETQNFSVSIICPPTAANYITSGPTYRPEDNSLVLTTRPSPPLSNEEVMCTVTMRDTGGTYRHPTPEPEFFVDVRAPADDEADDLALRIGFRGAEAPSGVVGAAWQTLPGPALADFTSRSMHAMLAYDGARGEYEGSVWVLGGYHSPPQTGPLPTWSPPSRRLLSADSTRVLNDVWRVDQGSCLSGDALASCTRVTPVTAAAAWPARHSHSAASFAGRMWLLGGAIGGAAAAEDVWSSQDGASWRLESQVGGFGARIGASLVPLVRDGAGSRRHLLLLVGGLSRTGAGEVYFGDVWGGAWSEGGRLQWSLLSQAPGFSPRAFHAAASSNYAGAPMAWVSGGFEAGLTTARDVWSTADGVSWTRSIDPPFAPRAGHAMSYCRGTLFVVGGVAGTATDADVTPYFLGDAWVYEGDAWSKVSGLLPFESRDGAAMACSGGVRLVLSGGQSADVGSLGDIIASPCAATETGCSS